MDPDQDPAIFVIDLQDANKKLILTKFLFIRIRYVLKVHLDHFSKIKSPKSSHKTVEIKVFLTIFA